MTRKIIIETMGDVICMPGNVSIRDAETGMSIPFVKAVDLRMEIGKPIEAVLTMTPHLQARIEAVEAAAADGAESVSAMRADYMLHILKQIERDCSAYGPHPHEGEIDFGSMDFNTSDDYAAHRVARAKAEIGNIIRSAFSALDGERQKIRPRGYYFLDGRATEDERRAMAEAMLEGTSYHVIPINEDHV